MHKGLRCVALAAGERSVVFPWALNAAAYCWQFLRALPERYSDEATDYTGMSGLFGTEIVAFNDQEMNFFVRAACVRRPDFIVELGAYTLARTQALAACFPEAQVYGLDITRDFAVPRLLGAITIGPNRPEHIADINQSAKGHGLLCARGTLCYYRSEDLRHLFEQTFVRGMDIALSEPTTVHAYAITHPWRRTKTSFYHPYRAILHAVGYDLPDSNINQSARRDISWFCETRDYIFAQHPGPRR